VAELTGKIRPRGLFQTAVHDISRLATITNVLVRHGFSEFARRQGMLDGEAEADADTASVAASPADARDTAKRFRHMLEELGPTFVKVGQILSTRPDVLPKPFIDELTLLQDAAPTVPFEEIRAQVEHGLGLSLDEAFGSFDTESLASASMAQTHCATLKDGTEVVVKVQRPGIAETIRSDLDLLHLFARLLEATIREMDIYAPADLVRVLDGALSDEVDFMHEAEMLESVAAGFADSDAVHIPALFRSHTARTVLTMERIRGTSPARIAEDDPRREDIALALIDAFYCMVFEHGTFHGDLHPGNIFVEESGRIAFIDFGLCGYLSTAQRDRLVALIIAVLAGDTDGTARTLVRMGQPIGPIDMAAFKDEVASIRERYLRRNLRHIDLSAFMEECFDAAQRYRIRIASDYSILAKSAVTLEGIVRQLSPELDLVAHAAPYQRRLLSRLYSADRILQGSLAGAMHLGGFLRDVPEQLGQVLMDAEAGRLQIRVAGTGADHLARELNRQTTRVFMAVLCAGLIIATPLFADGTPLRWRGVPVASVMCLLGAASLAFWGLAWHIVGGRVKDGRIALTPLLKLLRRRK
jgi:ubiquinone biosynthesis protein